MRHPSILGPSLLGLAATGLLAVPCGAAILHVNAGLVGGANDGTSWDNAFVGVDALANALAASNNGDQIWVAAGLYRPTAGSSRTISLTLKTGVAVYGGFEGSEAVLEERDWTANETVLSGDLAENDPLVNDNSYHVVKGGSANATAVLDGFTIVGGNANGSMTGDNDRGGGALMVTASSATIRNCRFVGNRCTFGGGAVYVRQSSPSFTDCSFEENLGGQFGGAFDIFNVSNPTFTNCFFVGNTAARAGGVEVFGNCQPKLRNCVFFDNTSTGSGGGGAVYVASSSVPQLRNCTIVGNHANVNYAGVLSTGSTTSIANCVVWGNTGPGGSQAAIQQVAQIGSGSTVVTYSCVQNGFAGTGNIATDPNLADQAMGDLHLLSGSPCIDAGSNALVPAGVTTDADGLPRFVDDPDTADTGSGTPPLVDMGAYEFQVAAPCVGDLDRNGTVDGADLGLLLAAWGTPGGDLDGSGSTDGADLGLLLAAWGGCR
ncbi:MAG: hypothetical protein KDA22_09315 [Phycisphaerales bacterium]|nr:hypothetical protein [Phycisphaerales bacterium]